MKIALAGNCHSAGTLARKGGSGIRIALAGNPNAGKTSIFNGLTGSAQHVGNFPGVTVECMEGTARLGGVEATVVDLPGTYSLLPYSPEERLARDFIVEGRADAIVCVVDASNLERNLYLTVQIMETRAPMVLALNMADVAKRRGMAIDTERLAKLLGMEVVPTQGSQGRGLKALLAACERAATAKRAPAEVTYGHEVQREVDHLAELVAEATGITLDRGGQPRWLAAKLIEGESDAEARLAALAPGRSEPLIAVAAACRARIEQHFGETVATVIAERRHGFAAGATRECVKHAGPASDTRTERIDAVVCGRVSGPVVLFAVVAALFFLVFHLSNGWKWLPWVGGWRSPTGVIEWCMDGLGRAMAGLTERAPLLHSLLHDGIVAGVGGVLAYVPLIFFMFLFVSALEDSGYVARVAFLMDRMLRMFGLQGKSILALIMSGGLGAGGCAVPGVLATRTLREEKDRLVTMLVVPFMSCGAKMPVYALLIAAFFPKGQTRAMLALWASSWLVALSLAWVLRRLVVRGPQTPFVMELPPYHVPTWRGVLLHTRQRTWLFVKKAATLVLVMSVVLWALMSFPRPADPGDKTAALATSAAGRLGTLIEPVTQLAGFDWRVNVALIGGLAAKEVIVGTLGTVYAMEVSDAPNAASLSTRLAADSEWTRARAAALMIFVMLYAPCVATLTAIRRESHSWRWPLFSLVYSTVVAFVLAVVVYQVGVRL